MTDIPTDDELQGALWSLANTLVKEVLDRVAGLDLLTVLAFPPGEGPVPSLDVALAKHLNNMNNCNQLGFEWSLEAHTMVKDVFQIKEFLVLEF